MVAMRAAVYRRTGPAEAVLEVTELERPEPGPGQVRVLVAVSAVNPTDVKNRAGLAKRTIEEFQVPHMDGAGIIDAVGPGVDDARIGQPVWMLLAAHENRYGTAAEYAVVPQGRAVALPEGVAFDLAATLGVPAVTAADCLLREGSIVGRDVLVAGGAGGVGRAAIQMAKWAGARVAATVSGATKAEVASGAGADLVVNYRDDDAIAQLQSWSDGFDRIVEVSLGANVALDAAVAARDATIVAYATDGGDATIPASTSLWHTLTYRYTLLYNLSDEHLALAVGAVNGALSAGALDMPPTQRFALDRVADAQIAQEAGPFGRVLVDIRG